jgi:hypothetical protein
MMIKSDAVFMVCCTVLIFATTSQAQTQVAANPAGVWRGIFVHCASFALP